MHIHRILIMTVAWTGAVTVGVISALAQDTPEETPAAEEETTEGEAAEETPEQKTARELCTETAPQSVYKEWSVAENRTCQNSFAETCVAIRKSDKARFSHACYEPLPPLPEEDEGETG